MYFPILSIYSSRKQLQMFITRLTMRFFSLLSLYLSLLFLTSSSSGPLTKDDQLKQYLHKFGYLNLTNNNDISDAEFESAISLYQSKHGLPVTGQLDLTTSSQISVPRCGVPDMVNRFAYFPGHPRWARRTLTYAISPRNKIDYVPRPELEAAVRRAFERWARVIPVRFVHAKHYNLADVKLGFLAGSHGDGEPFDGMLGVLAHAFSPESGRLHLDAAERWAVDFRKEGSEVAVDLESVVTHEIGHVLGLGHSAVKGAVMYPSLSPRTKKVELTVDDVEGVQALYGSNPNFKFSSLLESDTSDAMSLIIGWRSFVGIIVGVLISTLKS